MTNNTDHYNDYVSNCGPVWIALFVSFLANFFQGVQNTALKKKIVELKNQLPLLESLTNQIPAAQEAHDIEGTEHFPEATVVNT
jgi:hypothetical protein